VTTVELAGSPVGVARGVRPPWTGRRIALTVIGAGLAATVVWAWLYIDMSLSGIWSGLGDVRRLIERMVPPTFDDLSRTIELAVETFFIALLGTLVAALLSLPIGVIAARNTTPHPVAYYAARGVIVFCRAVPDLVFAFIFVRSIGLGVLAGVTAIALHSIGMIGKLFADAIEQVDEQSRDAVRSTGAGPLQDLATAVLPQVLPSFIGTSLYRLDINVRISVVLGFVGAGGIGLALQSSLRGLAYQRALGILTVIVVMIIAVEMFSASVRRSLLGPGSSAFGGQRRTTGRRKPPVVQPPPAPTATAATKRRITPPWNRERITKAAFLALFVGLAAAAFVSVDLSPLELLAGIPDIIETTGRLLPPSLGGLPWIEYRDALLQSISVGLVATVIGALIGIPVGMLAARNVAPARWVYVAVRGVLVLWRSVPELILAVIFVAAIGLGPVGGSLALGLSSAGFLAKLVADSLEEINPMPREAVLTTGATRLQETATSVVPQASPSIVGHVLYGLDINFRTSTILGLVGGGGIGFLLFNSMRVLRYDVTGAILIIIFATVYAIELLGGLIRRLLI
jgi:phosphonate transport system permease protein